ncbi:MAG: SCO family protein [Rhodospirillales bacterium]|jgi:protein SCO1|nr:SCO family protein [Rhodospirillales bacterium]
MIFRALFLVGLMTLTAYVGYKGWKMYEFNQLTSQERANILVATPIEGKYSLTDHNGQRVTEQTYSGRHTLIFFGYTWCPDVCPTLLTDIAFIMDELGEASDKVVPLFISVDPERDTVSVLKEYVGEFHPGIVGLTGSLDDVAAAAKSFRVGYGKVVMDPADPEDYSMSHSADLFLMGPDGKPVKQYRFGVDAEALVKDIQAVLTDG